MRDSIQSTSRFSCRTAGPATPLRIAGVRFAPGFGDHQVASISRMMGDARERPRVGDVGKTLLTRNMTQIGTLCGLEAKKFASYEVDIPCRQNNRAIRKQAVSHIRGIHEGLRIIRDASPRCGINRDFVAPRPPRLQGEAHHVGGRAFAGRASLIGRPGLVSPRFLGAVNRGTIDYWDQAPNVLTSTR
jgi:hypothetical protein